MRDGARPCACAWRERTSELLEGLGNEFDLVDHEQRTVPHWLALFAVLDYGGSPGRALLRSTIAHGNLDGPAPVLTL